MCQFFGMSSNLKTSVAPWYSNVSIEVHTGPQKMLIVPTTSCSIAQAQILENVIILGLACTHPCVFAVVEIFLFFA